jgi:hypothetical protein
MTNFFPNDFLYDLETYKSIFSMTIVTSDGKQGYVFEVSKRKDNRKEMFTFLDQLKESGARMIGFNNLAFDYPILHFILKKRKFTPEDVYNEAQRIIDSMKESRFGKTISPKYHYVEQVDLYKINHFDNAAKSTSLKILKFNMRLEDLQDLPYDISTDLTEEQLRGVILYNIDDVIATLKFYQENYGALELRKNLSQKYGIDFTNMNDAKIGSEIFIQEIEAATPNSCYKIINGRKEPNQTKRPNMVINDIIFPYVEFKRPEFRAISNWLKSQVITATNGVFSNILESDLGEVAKYADMVLKRSKKLDVEPTEADLAKVQQEIPLAEIEVKELKSGKKSYFYTWKEAENLNVVINGHKYVFGTGGLHSSVDAQTVISDDDHILVDWDVNSFYPHLAIQNDTFPKHLGIQFCKTYLDMYNQRKTYAKNTPENLSIKLALNSTYGNSNNQYSPFYDPQYTMTITLNGQLSLCMLIESILELPEASSVQSNTDGITMKIRKEDSDKADKIVKQWEIATKLEMERNDYSKMFIRDVNNYISVYAKTGKVKLKGAYVYELEHHKDQSCIVVQKAVAEHLATGIDIAEYITNHKDKFDFMLRTKVPKSMTLVLVDDSGNETIQQNVSRYYVSNGEGSGSLIKIMPPVANKVEDRRAGICVGNKVKICNNVLDFSWDIDYSYYIAEAKKLADVF